MFSGSVGAEGLEEKEEGLSSCDGVGSVILEWQQLRWRWCTSVDTISTASQWGDGGGCGTYCGSRGEGCPKPHLHSALAIEDVAQTSLVEEKSIPVGVAERRKKKEELPPTIVTIASSQNRCGEGGGDDSGNVILLKIVSTYSRWNGGGLCGKDGGGGGERCPCRSSRAEKSE